MNLYIQYILHMFIYNRCLYLLINHLIVKHDMHAFYSSGKILTKGKTSVLL